VKAGPAVQLLFHGGRGKTHALEKFLQGFLKDLQGLLNL
jgi:hypothetical protein